MLRKMLMLVAGASLLFGQISVTRPAVAAIDDPLAVRYNPAGLAFNKQTESIFLFHYDGQAFTKDFAYYSQTQTAGFGYQWDVASATNTWSFSQGIKLSDSQALGFTYSFDNGLWKQGRYDLGWMHRPLSLLAIGVHVQNIWTGGSGQLAVTGGLAFQNRKGRWGGGLDVSTLRDNSGIDPVYSTSQMLTAFVEPVEGFRVNAYVDLGATSSVGISLGLNLSEVGVETHTMSDALSVQTIGIRTSKNPYRTMFNQPLVKADVQTYIRFKLDGLIIEEPEQKKPKLPFDFNFDIPFIGQPVVYGKQLKHIIDELNGYTADPDIHGLIIELGHIRGGFGKMSEIRAALQRFHDAGKQIIVYSKFGLSNLTTYLLSMADEIYVHEMAGVDLRGLAMEVTFFRGLLDTLSIVPEVWRVSPYKTASDVFLDNEMSAAMRENYSQLLDGIYTEFVAGIAEGKGWTPEKTHEVIDAGPYMLSGEAQEAGLITGTLYPDEFDQYVKDLNAGHNRIIKPENNSAIPGYQYAWRAGEDADKIAVIYAVGGIVTGKSKPGPAGSKSMGDETIAKAIKQAREDQSIKAIVLRIDSGGGSALASDIIWREILKTTETDTANIKPLIASMSDVAGSGGYYIACQADRIVAYPATLTGSIGVIGMRLNYSQLKERFGMHTSRIKLGERADFASGNRLATPEESAMILASISDVYHRFKERVVKGRDGINDINALDSIALGRVWTGKAAQANGLIDRVGGYYSAIDVAKAAAGLSGDVELVELPHYKKKNEFKQLLDKKTNLELSTKVLLASFGVNDLIPILEGGEIQMIMPVKIDIK